MTSLMNRREGEQLPLQITETETRALNPESGKIGWAILWLLGVPLPVLLIVYLIWGR